jgi:hypothetical protein
MATTISEKIGQCETPKNRKEQGEASVVKRQAPVVVRGNTLKVIDSLYPTRIALWENVSASLAVLVAMQ